MNFFQLHQNVLRNHLGAKIICFKVDNQGTLIESVIIGKDTKIPWALIEDCQAKFDKSDCDVITEKAYKSHYEDANYIISQ